MPSVIQVATCLKQIPKLCTANHAIPDAHTPKAYTHTEENVPNHIVEQVVMALCLPSAFGRIGKRGELGKAGNINKDLSMLIQTQQGLPGGRFQYPQHHRETS